MAVFEIGSFKRLLTKYHREADIFALRDGEGDAEAALLLHLTNLDRLLLYAYRQIDRGALFQSDPRPSTKERCHAVIARLQAVGFKGEALTDDRLAYLMRLSGRVKHTLLPQVVEAKVALVQARQTFETLYSQLFGELVPWCPTLQDPRNLAPVVLEFPEGQVESILWNRIRTKVVPHLHETETEVLDLLGRGIITDAIDSISVRSVQSCDEYDALGQTAWTAIVEEFADGYDFERDVLVADKALRALAGLRSIIRTEAEAIRMISQDYRLTYVADATLARMALHTRFAAWADR